MQFSGRSTYMSHSNGASSSHSRTSIAASSNDSATWNGKSRLISKSTPMPHKNIKRTTVKPLGLVAGDLLGGFEKGSTTCNLRFPPDIGVLDPFRSHRFLLKLAMGTFFTGRKTARW